MHHLTSFFSTVTELRGKAFGGCLGSLRNPLTYFPGLPRASGVTRETSLKVTNAWNGTGAVTTPTCVFCFSTSRPRAACGSSHCWNVVTHRCLRKSADSLTVLLGCPSQNAIFLSGWLALRALHETVVIRTSLTGLTHITAVLY